MSVKTAAQNHKWWIKDGKIGLAKGSNDTATDYISPSAVHTVRYHYIKRDEDFTEAAVDGIGMTESPAIPEEFDESLTHFAIARGYEKKPDMINSAIYF